MAVELSAHEPIPCFAYDKENNLKTPVKTTVSPFTGSHCNNSQMNDKNFTQSHTNALNTASQSSKDFIICNLASNNSTPASPYPKKNPDPYMNSQPSYGNFFQILDMTPENPVNLCAKFASPLPNRKRIIKANEKFDFSVRKHISENTSSFPVANT